MKGRFRDRKVRAEEGTKHVHVGAKTTKLFL